MSKSNEIRRRALHFKSRTIALRREVSALKKELKAARETGYVHGSAATMGAIHDALNDGDLSLWISQRLLAQRVKLPPFHLSPEKQAMVRAEVAALLKACGIKRSPTQIAELPL